MSGQRWFGNHGGAFNRQILADEPVLQIATIDADIVVEVTVMSLEIVGSDDLNETNAIEVVRYSSLGTGGLGLFTDSLESGGNTDSGVTPRFVGSAGWTITPVVSDVLGGAYPFNLAGGWHWPPKGRSTGPIVISPGSAFGMGFRLVDTLSAAMDYKVSASYKRIGG